jgi:CheY-like chemotaxis protein
MSPICRLLLVEDDPHEARAIEQSCCPDPTNVALDVISNGADAENALQKNEYDLVICDLALPADGREVDPDTAEGLRLFELIREQSQGTPVIILSGHADLHMASGFLQHSRVSDLFGTQTDQPLVQFFPKEDLPDCIDAVQTHIAKTAALDSFELRGVELPISDQRALKIYGRRQKASLGVVEALDGGLSDAKTLKMSLIDPNGADGGKVVVKLGSLTSVIREASKYETVAARLPVGLGALVLHVVRAGAGKRGALVYQLADEHTRSLFGLIDAREDSEAARVVVRLQERLSVWAASAPEVVRDLAALRRPLVSDMELHQAGTVVPIERSIEVNVKDAMSHGDMHGLNVLVNNQNEPTLIDYGEVRKANAALDPVTLELSMLYHPAMVGKLAGWPTEEQASVWYDLDQYCVGCPVEGFVRACRGWAIAVSAGREELLATAYAYSIRQTKYGDNNKALAMSVALGAFNDLVSP